MTNTGKVLVHGALTNVSAMWINLSCGLLKRNSIVFIRSDPDAQAVLAYVEHVQQPIRLSAHDLVEILSLPGAEEWLSFRINSLAQAADSIQEPDKTTTHAYDYAKYLTAKKQLDAHIEMLKSMLAELGGMAKDRP